MCCGGIGPVATVREMTLSYGQLEPTKNKYGNFGVTLSYGTAYRFDNIAKTTASYTPQRVYNPVVDYGRQTIYHSNIQTIEIHPETKDEFKNNILVYDVINKLQEKIQRKKNGEREIFAINE